MQAAILAALSEIKGTMATRAQFEVFDKRLQSVELGQQKQQQEQEEMRKGMQSNADAIREIREELAAARRDATEGDRPPASVAGSGPRNLGLGVGSPTRSAAPSTTASEGDWVPRTVQIRGFAPYGCPVSDKLTKAQFKPEVANIMAALPREVREGVRATPPFVLNYQITLVVEGQGGWQEVRSAKLAIEKALAEGDVRINGRELRVGTQTSPARKLQLSNLFSALDALKAKGVGEEKVEVCHRTLQIYQVPGYGLVGKSCEGSWRWEASTVGEMGLSQAELEADRQTRRT